MSQQEKIRCRRWAFTLNNYTQEEVDSIKGIECEYLIFGKETGDEGTPHLQGYIVFKNATRFSTLKNKMPRAHVEAAIRGHDANIKYCKKQGDYYEKGEIKKVKKSDVFLDDIEKVKPKDLMAHLNGVRLINGMKMESKMLDEIREDKLEKPQVIYIHGKSGTGKTYTAYKMACEKWNNWEIATLEFKNGFAMSNNYHARCLILQEFRPSCIDAASFLQFLDGYGCVLNVKGSHVYIRPKMIIICSIKSPYDIYREEMNDQFIRRLTTIIDKDNSPFDWN